MIVLGEYQKAIDLSEKALKAFQESKLDRVVLSKPLHDIGWANLMLGDCRKSLYYLRKSLKLSEEYYDSNHVEIAYLRNSLGACMCICNQCSSGVKLMKNSTKIISEYYGHEHPFSAISFNNLGNAYRINGNMNESLKLLKKSLRQLSKKYSSNHNNIAAVYANLGLLVENFNPPSSENIYFKKAFDILVQNLPKKSPHVLKIQEIIKNKKRDLINYNNAGYFMIY